MPPWALQGSGHGPFTGSPGHLRAWARVGPRGLLWAALGPCAPGPCGPLGPCGLAPCGPPTPLWAPWALVDRALVGPALEGPHGTGR